MTKEIRISTTNLYDVCLTCFKYIMESSMDDRVEREDYIDDLIGTMRLWEVEGGIPAFHYLITTGVFHDAMGKVVDIYEDKVIVTTEY